MRSPFTTRISSKGQLVIPGPVRKALGIEAGASFLVVAQKDTIVLHRLQEPPWEFFEVMVKTAERQGKQHDAAMQGLTKFMKKLKYGR